METNDKDYNTEKNLIGNMKKAKRAIENLEFAKKMINTYIFKRLTPEQRVAIELKNNGITEEEFLNMPIKQLGGINGAQRVNIANILRDLWRKETKAIYGK